MYDGLSYPKKGYWTMSVESSSMFFYINSMGYINTSTSHDTNVVRAVIEINRLV